MATISKGGTLPDTGVTKNEVYALVDSATISAIVNADIDAAAAIVDTKLATISTAGKVNTTALVTTSQAAGDVIYNDGTNWLRLAKDAGKYLKSGASAVSWDNPVSVSQAIGTSDITTSSDTLVDMTDMSLTVGAGNFLIIFVAPIRRTDTNGFGAYVGLNIDSSQVVFNTARIADANYPTNAVLLYYGTIAGAGVIKVQWKRYSTNENLGQTATTDGERVLTAIKIG